MPAAVLVVTLVSCVKIVSMILTSTKADSVWCGSVVCTDVRLCFELWFPQTKVAFTRTFTFDSGPTDVKDLLLLLSLQLFYFTNWSTIALQPPDFGRTAAALCYDIGATRPLVTNSFLHASETNMLSSHTTLFADRSLDTFFRPAPEAGHKVLRVFQSSSPNKVFIFGH